MQHEWNILKHRKRKSLDLLPTCVPADETKFQQDCREEGSIIEGTMIYFSYFWFYQPRTSWQSASKDVSKISTISTEGKEKVKNVWYLFRLALLFNLIEKFIRLVHDEMNHT